MREPEFSFVQRLVLDEAGLVLETGKAYLADIRLAELARQEGFVNAEALVQRLRDTPRNGLHRRVVESLLVHETRFFRDENSFQLFRKAVLPALVDRAGRGGVIGVWSAGCSTGQEPYSLAMVLNDELPPTVRARILATDFSEPALERARNGVYSVVEVNRGLPTDLRGRYLTPLASGDWRVKDELRGVVEFRSLNLVKPWGPLLPMDVIFLRNVMIYFNTENKKAILARVRQALRPGGYLFLGGTEAALTLDTSFRLVEKEQSWCYQYPAVPAAGGRV